MKLLAIETRQYLNYYISRYHQVEGLGADVYVLVGEGSPDFWRPDRYRLVGSKNIDDMGASARDWHAEQHFDGVITFAEPSVIATAAIAEQLGLPGIGVQAAVRSRNKYLMRQAYEQAGAAIPSYRLVSELDEALAAADDFGYPVVFKPTLGAASNFVFRVDSGRELTERFRQAEAGIRNVHWINSEVDGIELGPNAYLIESFLDGRECLMEAVAWDDEVYLGSIVDRITLEGSTYDDDVHHAPTSLSDDHIAKVHALVTTGAHAQGLRRSVMHAEVRFHHGEPHLLEIAARVGGGPLDMVAKITADHDPIRALVDISRGVPPKVRHFQPTGVHTASMCLMCDEGVIANVDVPPEVEKSDRVFLLKITGRPGDVIRRPPNGNSILGFLGTTGASEGDAFEAMNYLASQIQVAFA
jgi:biotin carboxylase